MHHIEVFYIDILTQTLTAKRKENNTKRYQRITLVENMNQEQLENLALRCMLLFHRYRDLARMLNEPFTPARGN